MIRLTWKECLLFLTITFCVGVWTTALAYRRVEMKSETHAPAVVQVDGSVVLERNPAKAQPELPEMPHGASVTRVTTIEIEPAITPIEPGIARQPSPIVVQLTQIETDQGSRVIASTQDGRIIGGSDWTKPIPVPHVYRWQAQAVRAWTWEGAAWGASVGYTRGPMVVTVTGFPGQIQAGLGIRW